MTRRWSRKAKATAFSSPRPASALCRKASTSRETEPAPATRSSSAARLAITASRCCQNARTLSSKPRSCRTAPPFTASSRIWWRRCPAIHCLRDPTRGGLASTLNEIAQQSRAGMRLAESAIPFKADVLAACELLGLDPLYIANEGKLIAICEKGDAGAPSRRDARPPARPGRRDHRGGRRRRPRFRPDADPVRRKPHGGLAARRPPAADLLRHAPDLGRGPGVFLSYGAFFAFLQVFDECSHPVIHKPDSVATYSFRYHNR